MNTAEKNDQYHEMFYDPDGDVILRSSDGVLFRTHSFILRRSSSFFGAMFSLPQPSSLPQSSQTITLDEDSSVITPVLMMVYNVAFPSSTFDDLNTVEIILQFCEKYGMPGPTSIVRSAILRPSLLGTHPLQIHALSCRYEWHDVAQATAMPCLSRDITAPSTVAALRGVDLPHYSRLLSLARRRKDTFREHLDSPAQFQGSDPNYTCGRCLGRVGDLTWKVLRMRLVEELGKCPDGSSIRGDGLRLWPEWVASMTASHCNKLLFNAEGTRTALIRVLDSLPENLLLEDASGE